MSEEVKVSDTMEIVVSKDETVVLTMYGHILNEVIRLVDGLDNVPKVLTDAGLQSKLIDVMIAEYDDEGNKVGTKVKKLHLTATQWGELISWGTSHIANFTIQSSQKTVEMMEEVKNKFAKTLIPTTNG